MNLINIPKFNFATSFSFIRTFKSSDTYYFSSALSQGF